MTRNLNRFKASVSTVCDTEFEKRDRRRERLGRSLRLEAFCSPRTAYQRCGHWLEVANATFSAMATVSADRIAATHRNDKPMQDRRAIRAKKKQ
jgi:hypothetical protein